MNPTTAMLPYQGRLICNLYLACSAPVLLLLVMPLTGLGTSWAPHKISCPLCGEKITVSVVVSSGSYIYHGPSKYQLVFWPFIDEQVLYFCRHCHLALFMGDFEKLASDKRESLRKALDPLKQTQANVEYYQVPMAYRLSLAEAAYRILGKDDSFWCHFYRVQGHHLAMAQKTDEALAARTKALNLAEKLLKAGNPNIPEKEALFVIGSMQYFTAQVQAAQATLIRMKALSIPPSKTMPEENARNFSVYLNSVAEEFLEYIRQGKPVPIQ